MQFAQIWITAVRRKNQGSKVQGLTQLKPGIKSSGINPIDGHTHRKFRFELEGPTYGAYVQLQSFALQRPYRYLPFNAQILCKKIARTRRWKGAPLFRPCPYCECREFLGPLMEEERKKQLTVNSEWKGQCREIFSVVFFHRKASPGPLGYSGTISILSTIRRDNRIWNMKVYLKPQSLFCLILCNFAV